MDDTDASESDEEVSGNQSTKHTAFDVGANEMRILQTTNPTLDAIREVAEGKRSTAGVGFFKRDGLLYRKQTKCQH